MDKITKCLLCKKPHNQSTKQPTKDLQPAPKPADTKRVKATRVTKPRKVARKPVSLKTRIRQIQKGYKIMKTIIKSALLILACMFIAHSWPQQLHSGLSAFVRTSHTTIHYLSETWDANKASVSNTAANFSDNSPAQDSI